MRLGGTAQGYSIDSRTVQPGELFFAVKGERLDGHDFVEQALSRGAIGAVVEKGQLARYPNATGLLAVDDTLVALQTLATAVRKIWGKTAIGHHRVDGQDHDQRSDGPFARDQVPRASHQGKFQQSFWPASRIADARTGIRRCRGRDGDVTRRAKSQRWRASPCPTRPWSPMLLPCIWRASTPSPASRARNMS